MCPAVTLGVDTEAGEEVVMEKPDRNPVTLRGAVYFSLLPVFLFLEPGPQWDDLKLPLPQPLPKCWNKSPHYRARLPSPLSLVYKTEKCQCGKGFIHNVWLS